jgi:tetratricopeptide (TPR) repeat protein
MRRIAIWLGALVVLVALVGFASVEDGSAAETPSCAAADALRDTHRLAEATAAYTAVLKDAPELECAIDGLTQVNEARERAVRALLAGQALLARGDVAGARQRFIAALQLDASDPQILAALTSLDGGGTTADAWAGVRALLAAGYDDEAAEAAKEILKKGGAVPPDIILPGRASSVDRFASGLPDWVRSALAVLGWLTSVLGSLLTFLLVVAALAFLFRPTRAWLRRLFGSERDVLAIEAIGDDATDVKGGKSLPQLITADLLALKQRGAAFRLGIATGPDTSVSLPEPVVDALPQGKLVAGLLELLSPAKWTVKGELLPSSGAAGPGMVLTLAGAGPDAKGVTLWGRDYDGRSGLGGLQAIDKADQFRTLAAASSAWVAYQVAERDYPLPTRNWESYARFGAGVWMQENGQRERARALYQGALELDRDNWMALFNLGMLEDGTASASLLRRAKQRLEQSAGKALAHDPLYYKLVYNLAVAEWTSSEPGTVRSLDARLVHGVRDAAKTLSEKGVDQGLRDFLTNWIDTTIVLLAGMRQVVPPILEQPVEGRPPAPGNLNQLIASIYWLKHNQLIAFLGRREVRRFLVPRVLYNLACYFALTGERTEAFEALEWSFASRENRIRAPLDPSLLPLREQPEWRPLLKKYGIAVA